MKALRRRGRVDDDAGPDDAPGALHAESIASGLPPAPDADPPRRSRRSAFLDGFSLHANTHLHEHAREGLERLTELPDGRLSYAEGRVLVSETDYLDGRGNTYTYSYDGGSTRVEIDSEPWDGVAEQVWVQRCDTAACQTGTGEALDAAGTVPSRFRWRWGCG